MALRCKSRSASAWPQWLLCAVLLASSAACRPVNRSQPVDRHNPEAVLRAYLDAWARNDSDTEKSFMTRKYTEMFSEPVESLQVLSIKPNDGALPNARVFTVDFEIKFKGRGFSMEDGRHIWTYTLTWDATRDSWLISNYGAG
jgi:uncharacterized protein DUF4829